MAQRPVRVPEGVGLHARPAAVFVQAAAKASGPVTIGRAEGSGVNAKSLLAVLGLDVRGGQQVVLRAEGEDAEQVLADLAALIEGRPAGD